MLKRTLVFSSPVNLTLRNCQLVMTYKDLPDNNQTIPIEDIAVVMIENQMATVSMPLLNALVDANVSVVLCNNKGMPNAMLQNLDSHNLQGEILRNQMEAGEVLKKQLWKQIVEAKIKNQSLLLCKLGKHGERLKPYYSNVKSGDADNREGIAARIYFQELFGDDFIRDRTKPGVNAFLNYGYTILRASVARALVSSGLFPAIGIFHRNRSNAFPLVDDIMEPYRPYVDEIVYEMWQTRILEVLDREAKAKLINVLYCDTQFKNVTRPLQVGLSISSASLAKCFAKDEVKLSFPTIE